MVHLTNYRILNPHDYLWITIHQKLYGVYFPLNRKQIGYSSLTGESLSKHRVNMSEVFFGRGGGGGGGGVTSKV